MCTALLMWEGTGGVFLPASDRACDTNLHVTKIRTKT
jgi:hypothetical protein